MRGILLLSLLLALAVDLPGQSQDPGELGRIAGLDSINQREEELRAYLRSWESIGARLAVLDEAQKLPGLEEASKRISLQLLLLSGRTEEAEKLLSELDAADDDLSLRLSLAHGKTALDETPGGAAPLDRRSFESLREDREESPEYFADRRGAIIAAPLLFSAVEASSPADVSPSDRGEGEVLRIQLGAFSTQKNAEAHLRYLADRGVPAELLPPVAAGDVYRTIVPRIPAETAQRELIRLKEKGIEGFIIYPEN